MNLSEDPSKDKLRKLIASCDDGKGNHLVWVDQDGEVHITMLPNEISPGEFVAQEPTLKFRCETFLSGNGYVGKAASLDDEWMSELFAGLNHAWKNGYEGYLDTFQAG